MASILSYINYVLQQDDTFHGLQMRLLRIETVVTKLNEIKLKCLKLCSLNSATFCAGKK